MKFFMSSEVDAAVADQFRGLRNEVAQKLKYLDGKCYGDEVKKISIIPIVVNLSPALEEAGFFKERIKYSKKDKDADIRLRIDFNEFLYADNEKRKALIVKNVLDSVSALGEKVKKGFDSEALKTDIKELFNPDFS